MKSPQNRRSVFVATLTLTATMAGALLVIPSAIFGQADDGIKNSGPNGLTTFTVDVAQDLARYVQNNVRPAQGQDVFARGDTYLVNGTVFPGNTIPRGKANNLPTDPGSIGKYRMRGTYTIDFDNFLLAVKDLPGANPVMGFATEIFTLPEGGENSTSEGGTIMTDGLWPNAHFANNRVVLGGTGRFREIVGVAYEENIGENALGFCNLRITFKVKRVITH